MDSRSALAAVRIVNVTKEGKDAGFSSLCDKLGLLPPTGFVAVDSEFSGLVSDPHLSDDDLNLRYQAVRRIADTRAIFSLGISIFIPVTAEEQINDAMASSTSDSSEGESEQEGSAHAYDVATYDFLLSCQDEFSTNANAGTFLAAHNFDFNHMFQKGIPYQRASTEKPAKGAAGGDASKEGMSWRWGKMPRGLLWRIGRTGVPLVLHNGLFDLAFLFAAFQGPLPPTLNGFIGALLECVPAGYWDSKMLASVAGARASFLGYLFADAVVKGNVDVRNCSGLPGDGITNPPDEIAVVAGKPKLCALYAFRGFCPRGVGCPFLHDPFLVVEEEKNGTLPADSKAAYKRHKLQSKDLKRQKSAAQSGMSKLSKKQKKRLLAQQQQQQQITAALAEGVAERVETAVDEPRDECVQTIVEDPVKSNEGKVHTAGWDAFCTGYVFAAYRALLPAEKLCRERNKIALSKKLSGLLLCRSNYANLDGELPSRNEGTSSSEHISEKET